MSSTSTPLTPKMINGISQRSNDPAVQTSSNSQQRSSSSHSSVKKKGVKDFELGRTLGEGSYSTVRRENKQPRGDNSE